MRCALLNVWTAVNKNQTSSALPSHFLPLSLSLVEHVSTSAFFPTSRIHWRKVAETRGSPGEDVTLGKTFCCYKRGLIHVSPFFYQSFHATPSGPAIVGVPGAPRCSRFVANNFPNSLLTAHARFVLGKRFIFATAARLRQIARNRYG